ncbi:MAG: energy-coupling factor transporter transmembrane component T [Clostridia bacterium]|nr:energy-coupling factor transporter transmembrane component T [Clostridia bacterium]
MKDIAFGQYYPIDSFVHRLDARTKLLITILFMVSVFFADSFFLYLFILLALVLMVAFSKISFIRILGTMKPIIVLAIITTVLNFFLTEGEGEPLFKWWIFELYIEGIFVGVKMLLRLIFLVMGASILTLTTTPVALTDAVEWLFYPLSYLRVPVRELALIMSIALKFIPNLVEEAQRIIKAQKARGANFESGGLIKRAKAFIPILIPLLVSSFRRADELALAMDARCYGYTAKRTKMKKLTFRSRDLLAGIVITLIFGSMIALRYCSGVIINGETLAELCPWIYYGSM